MRYCKNCKQNVEPHKKLSTALLVLLLICGIIPGVIYYVVVPETCPMCNSRNWGIQKEK